MQSYRLARWLNKVLSGGNPGVTLLETVIALAILGMVSVTFLGALSSISQSTFIADEQTTAESLARSQMERVKAAEYVYGATGYPPAPLPPSEDYINYSVAITAGALTNPDAGIQKITVTVNHSDKTVFVLEGYKGER
ncbi:MAG: type II secretion system protein [Dehalococcoidales bacterium]